MTESPDRIESLFADCVALTNNAEREAYLDRACSGDKVLRGHVAALLQAHDRAGHLLDRSLPDKTLDHLPDAQLGSYVAREQEGTIIAGRYKLLEAIGQGGMGAVWVAEQTEPVQRKVAIKLIKAGMDSKSVLARFEAERQALAVMDHPNIAKVLDGGMTDSGRPFFVMDYVKGVPITEYCDAVRLSVPERLNLFVQVCQAVQHAHQKGIIHRDLKPSNILVAPYDDKPVPKVIDFGLAKAMHQSLTERTLHTAHEAILGTPLYMSPEQAKLNNLDVDTRSDIYSLGVLLYELLTGTTPLEQKRFKQVAWDEIKRIMREEEPPRPSTRLSSSHTLPSLAAGRDSEPTQLVKLLRGELDWIVMKSLEKDRARRYDTATGFAMDVQRYLAGEPVLAVPPSAGYRLGKFARRHRAGLSTAAAIALLLVAGVAVSTWYAVRAKRAETVALAAVVEKEEARASEVEQRRRAEDNEQKAKIGEQKARESEAEAKAVLDFVQHKVFAAARLKDQEGGLGHDVKLADAVKASLPFINQSFKDSPLIEARLRNTIGLSFWYLGDNNTAAEQYESALVLYTRHLGPDHPATLEIMTNLATADSSAGRVQDALKLREETLRLRRAKLGSAHPDTLLSMNNLAVSFSESGRFQEALTLAEETLQLTKAKLGPEHPDTLRCMNNLARHFSNAGRIQDALQLQQATLPLMETRLGPNHISTLMCMFNLSNTLAASGRTQDAIELHEKTLQLCKGKLGPQHPGTLRCMNGLANSYVILGRNQEAIDLYEKALEGQIAKLGPDHPDTLTTMRNLGKAYCAINQDEKAVAILQEYVLGQRKRAKQDDPEFAGVLAQVALDLLRCRRHAVGEELLRESLTIREKTQPDVWTTCNTQSLLGGALMDQKKYTDAEPLLLAGFEGMKQREKTIPEQSKTQLREAIERLVQLYRATDKKDEVAKWQKELDMAKATDKKVEKKT